MAITDGSGAYTVTLPDGDYEIELDALTVPAGNMVPEIIEETYTGGPTTIDYTLVASDGTVSGVLADDFGPVHGYVFAWDGTGYTFTTTDVDGSYTLELAAGDWTLTAEREELAGSTGGPPSPGTPTLFPDPIFVSVSSGTALTGQDFFFADPFDPSDPTRTPSEPNADLLPLLGALARAVQLIETSGFDGAISTASASAIAALAIAVGWASA